MKHIFISYKRAEETTPVAEMFYKQVAVDLPASKGFARPFFDKKSIDAGDQWSQRIQDALDETTHFIALLSIDYWLSPQCQRELQEAVKRHNETGSPRLLFVLTEMMDPTSLEISGDEQSATVKKDFPGVQNLGQINFLGPYDQGGRLVRLNCSDRTKLGDQLFAMTQCIKNLD